MPKTYRFPKQGKALHTVVVEKDGVIKAKTGDTLLGYSMAIYGEPYYIASFEVLTESGWQTAADAEKERIFVHGNRVRHKPTHTGGPDIMSAANQHVLLRAYLNKQFGLSLVQSKTLAERIQKKVSKGITKTRLAIFLADLAQLLGRGPKVVNGLALALKPATAVTAGTVAHAAGAVLGPVAALITSGVAIASIDDTNRRVFGYHACSYAYAAWAFEHQVPAMSSFLSNLTRGNPRYGVYQSTWQKIAQETYAKAGPADARRRRLNTETYRFVLQTICGDNPAVLSEFLTREYYKKLDRFEKPLMKAHIDNKVFYNK